MKHSLMKGMLVLFFYLYILGDYAAAVNTRKSSDSALQDNPSRAPKLISVGVPASTKERKELPDLNKSPPISDSEEKIKSTNPNNQKEVQNRKSKYQRERERYAQLPANKKEEIRIKEMEKARRYRKNMKIKTGVTSKKVAHIKELRFLRKTGKSTIKQDQELDEIMNHKRIIRNKWRARKKLNDDK